MSRTHSNVNALYRDRIFGDDTTPEKPTASKSEAVMSNSELKEDYPFNRDAVASTRLHLQHQLWISSTGFHLHPKIPVPENALIADIGCGTGVWSLELSNKLPLGAKIEAADLSLAQTPPKEWWPKNVTFRQMDIFAEIPEHLVGRYDVVNIRLFLCVVQSGDPMPLLRSLMKLLKPGGYLQWQEYNPTKDKVVCADPSASAPKLSALREATNDAAPKMFKHHWIEDFHTRFSEAGGALMAHEKVWTAPDCRLIKQDITFLAVREWAVNLRVKDPKSEMADKMDKMVSEVEEECWKLQRGTMIDSEMVTWVARKN